MQDLILSIAALFYIFFDLPVVQYHVSLAKILLNLTLLFSDEIETVICIYPEVPGYKVLLLNCGILK